MEVKQFTQGQFADTFEGSAADFIKQLQTATPPPPANSDATPTVATPAVPVTDPLKPDMTLNPDQDATAAIAANNAKPEEVKPEEDAAAATAKAAEAKKAGRPPVEKLDAATKQLVESLIADKKLFGFQDGKIETKADLQDLLDANVNHRSQEAEKDVYQRVMTSMTPAMQFIAQYANQVTSPSELLPLLQSTSNIERFSALDENNATHQEMIVRERMRLSGDAEDVIEQEITDLKDRAKLADKAKSYKPLVQQFYQRQAQQLVETQQREEQQYMQTIQQNEQKVRATLDLDTLDGIKLNKQHKGAIYEMIAIPREQYGGGMGIYHLIDNLFQEGKFDKLAKIALLVADEKGFETAFGTKLKFENADRTIRALNTNGGKGGTPTVVNDDLDEPATPQLVRPTRTGFGFNSR